MIIVEKRLLKVANCYLVYSSETKIVLIIDPGQPSEELAEIIEKQ